MTQAVSTAAAQQGGRRFMKVSSNYRTDFIGVRPDKIEDKPEAFLIEMPANNSIPPHFHQVDQYQIFVAGDGALGRNPISLIGLHYVDHHTAYGPINTGALGLSFFTIRTRSDPGGIFLHDPGYKERLKPSKKRYLMADHVSVSTELSLQKRTDSQLDRVFSELDESDGLGSYVLRLGPNVETVGMDPGVTGGQFYLVLNGNLRFEGNAYPRWSTIYAGPGDLPLTLSGGATGAEALILNFPRPD